MCILGQGESLSPPLPSPPRGRGVAEPGAELASPRALAAGRRPRPRADWWTDAETVPAGSRAGGRPGALQCGRRDGDPELSTQAEPVSERRVSASLRGPALLPLLVLLGPRVAPSGSDSGPKAGWPQSSAQGPRLPAAEVRGGGWRWLVEGGVSSGAEMSG